MKKSIFIFALVLFGFVIFTGQKTDDGPRWSGITHLYPVPNYSPLPVAPDRFVAYSTVPRIYNTPVGHVMVNPSVRVLPSTATAQSELYLASNKANRNVLFGSSNNVTGSTINSGCFVSSDNGTTWGGWQVINEPSSADQRGDPGPVVDKNMRLVFSHLTSASNFGGVTGMGCNYSTNYGANWSATFQIESSSSADKNLSNTDDSPISLYYGNSYTAWCVLTSPATSRFARTTNGGVTWEPTMTISTSIPGHYVQGHDVACGPNGEVYVTWVANLASGQYPAHYLGLAKSTNGGANFQMVKDTAQFVSGARSSSFGGWGIRANDFPRIDVDKSGGPRNGWVYIVITEINHAPGGSDPDVILYRSSNGGNNFMPGVRVNQDALNNGKNQFFPAVKVDDYGGVNIIYYDGRNWAVGDSATVMISRSVDGGSTFTDIEVTDHHFKPKPASGMGGGYMGDYIGIASGNNKVWGFWMDDKATSSGFYNAWAGSMDIGPAITHTPLTNTEQISGSRPVNCVIMPAGSGINPSSAKLYYSKDNPSITNNTALTNSGGTNWTASLPITGAGLYRYYLTATDSLGRVATAPGGAPGNYYSFVAATDTVKPVVTSTPLPNTPKTQWPATVTATVTDNIGVDSAWVRWYKNSPSTGLKRFNLANTAGTTWSNPFNSTQADVAIGDSIFYRVIARDISALHNMDSTPLYSFKIINLVNACIGTGTSSSYYPYTTYWEDGRTDMLYTAAEITGQGGAPANIMKIGFNVITADPAPMNGFKVKLQNTSATSLTGFLSSGWTVCYDGVYTLPGTGWQYITLSTAFFWDGSSNLAVEVCYNNAAWTAYSPVNASSIAGMTWGQYTDLPTGDGCTAFTAGTSQAIRPNICLTMTPTLGVQNNNNTLPTKFALGQNYPNPFNPVTRISFDIPKQGLVNLRVYDVLGREVKVLVNEVKSPGSYNVDFNASDYSSGVYFYRIESSGFTEVKRMILIK